MVKLDIDLEKKSLRKILLEKRDNTSANLMEIASKKIQKKLERIEVFKKAKKIGLYYPTGSEIYTNDIIQKLLSESKEVYLPKVIGENLEFKKINDFSDLESGKFDILEPKENCQSDNSLDVIIVPCIGITSSGDRLGYGLGFYDRFLSKNKIPTIAITLEKQIVKNIPVAQHDIQIDWIVTEDQLINTQR